MCTYVHKDMTKGKRTISICLDEDIHKRYKLYAVEHDITFKDIFTEEMERRIKEAQKKSTK